MTSTTSARCWPRTRDSTLPIRRSTTSPPRLLPLLPHSRREADNGLPGLAASGLGIAVLAVAPSQLTATASHRTTVPGTPRGNRDLRYGESDQLPQPITRRTACT